MPLYEYRCSKCGHQFEKIRKFSDPPLTKCEECGGKVERLLSSPAIKFKGSGWYITDYARKNSAEGKEKSDHQPGEKKEAPSGGNDDKPSTSSDSKGPASASKPKDSKHKHT